MTTSVETPWLPPPYTLRTSKRAKRLSLQISSQGLEVILPMRARQPNIDHFLFEKRSWIERNLNYYQKIQALRKQEPTLPETLNLVAIQKIYRLAYFKINSSRIHIKQQFVIDADFLVTGPIENAVPVKKALNRLLLRLAEIHLLPWLESLSKEASLPYSGVTLRRQTTLWGSCNIKQQISLNAKLLFLPAELVRYVLLHELCHTRYLNHSKRFWGLLQKFDPLCLKHRRTLRHAQQFLPAWVE